MNPWYKCHSMVTCSVALRLSQDKPVAPRAPESCKLRSSNETPEGRSPTKNGP
jgi:hypothetical protein